MKYDFSRFLYVLSVMIVGGILGIGTALLAVQYVNSVESVKNGPWQTNAEYGRADQSRWLRTAIALSGLFALRREEAVYFTAFRDGSGERLTETCTYVLTGRTLPARWWSVTLYARDHYLIPNAENKWSVTADQVQADAQGRIQIQVGGEGGGPAWIPSAGGGEGLSLTLRLYNPEPAIYETLESAPLFDIDQAGCS